MSGRRRKRRSKRLVKDKVVLVMEGDPEGDAFLEEEELGLDFGGPGPSSGNREELILGKWKKSGIRSGTYATTSSDEECLCSHGYYHSKRQKSDVDTIDFNSFGFGVDVDDGEPQPSTSRAARLQLEKEKKGRDGAGNSKGATTTAEEGSPRRRSARILKQRGLQGENVMSAEQLERRLRLKARLAEERRMIEESLDPENDPFKRLPDVVIRDFILKKVGPKEKIALAKVCPRVRKYLESSKQAYLLCDVLPIIPFIEKLWFYEVVQMRAVCRDWQQSVDYLLEHSNEIEPDYSTYKTILHPMSRCYSYRDWSTETLKANLYSDFRWEHHLEVQKIERFLAHMGNHPRNPLPSRRVHLVSFGENNEREAKYWDNVQIFLEKFGKELRGAEITFDYLPSLFASIRLQSYLEWMPDVETLACKVYGARQAAATVIQLPELERVRSLRLYSYSSAINNSFSMYFNQLVSFTADTEYFLEWYDPYRHPGFPNLKYFSTKYYNRWVLPKLLAFSCPLNEIKIDSYIHNMCPSVFFHYLEHFKDTLAVIHLDQIFSPEKPKVTLKDFNVKRKPDSLFQIPHLKVLRINLGTCGCGHNLDSLLQLSHPPNYLDIKASACFSYNEQHNPKAVASVFNETLQIQYYFDKMYHSNIWEKLTTLQELDVFWVKVRVPYESEKYLYKRDTYDIIMNARRRREQELESWVEELAEKPKKSKDKNRESKQKLKKKQQTNHRTQVVAAASTSTAPRSKSKAKKGGKKK